MKSNQLLTFLVFSLVFALLLTANVQADCIGSTYAFPVGSTINESCTFNQSEECPAGTCFNVRGFGHTIDCNGETLLGVANGARGFDIDNTEGIIIQNCIFENNLTTGNSTTFVFEGIYGTSGVIHPIIMDNTFINITRGINIQNFEQELWLLSNVMEDGDVGIILWNGNNLIDGGVVIAYNNLTGMGSPTYYNGIVTLHNFNSNAIIGENRFEMHPTKRFPVIELLNINDSIIINNNFVGPQKHVDMWLHWSNNNHIIGNNFINGTDGINIDTSSNNLIEQNYFQDNTHHCLIFYVPGTGTVQNNTFKNNTCLNPIYCGVTVGITGTGTVSNNYVGYNNFTGWGQYGLATYYIGTASNLTVEHNIFDAAGNSPTFSVWLQGNGHYFNNNTVINNAQVWNPAVWVNGITNTVIRNNNISNNSGGGMSIYQVSSPTNKILNNNFEDNLEFGLKLLSSSNQLIKGNTYLNNEYGIWIDSASDNTFIQESINDSTNEDIYFYHVSNYANYFINSSFDPEKVYNYYGVYVSTILYSQNYADVVVYDEYYNPINDANIKIYDQSNNLIMNDSSEEITESQTFEYYYNPFTAIESGESWSIVNNKLEGANDDYFKMPVLYLEDNENWYVPYKKEVTTKFTLNSVAGDYAAIVSIIDLQDPDGSPKYYSCWEQRSGFTYYLGIYQCNNLYCDDYDVVGLSSAHIAPFGSEQQMTFYREGDYFYCEIPGVAVVQGFDSSWFGGYEGLGVYYANVTYDDTEFNYYYGDGVIPRQNLTDFYYWYGEKVTANNYRTIATYNEFVSQTQYFNSTQNHIHDGNSPIPLYLGYGCVGATQTFGCGSHVTESCTFYNDMYCNVTDGLILDTTGISINGNGYTLTVEGAGNDAFVIQSNINNYISDLIFSSDDGYDLYFDAGCTGTLNATNVTFDDSNTDFHINSRTIFYRNWYVDILVEDYYHNPQGGAIVQVFDEFNNLMQQTSTYGTGFTPRQNVSEYREDYSGRYDYINIFFVGYLYEMFKSNVSESQITGNLLYENGDHIIITVGDTEPIGGGFLNLRNIFVNQIAGDEWIFIFLSLVAITFFCAKFRMPNMITFMINLVWLLMISPFIGGTVILALVLAIAATFLGWMFIKLLTR